MTFEFHGDFKEVKPGFVVCSFCVLVNDAYPGGMKDVENESTRLIIERHLILAHGLHFPDTDEIGLYSR